MKKLFKNIGLLQTPVGNKALRGKAQGENQKLKDAAIIVEDGMISEIFSRGQLPEAEDFDEIIDCEGKFMTPGLVDGHTHMIFGGYRQKEVPLKLKGASYLEILNAGGGIKDTVKKTREASFEELYDKTKGFLDEMASLGVTTCEAKSGYGIDLDNEVKLLRVLKKLDEDHPLDIVRTFMGAHVVLEEWKGKEDQFIQLCIDEMMPYIKQENLAEYIDIFTEDSVFNYEQSKRYLEAGREMGFKLKIHADEIKAIGGSALAGRLNTASAEHLIVIDEIGLKEMSKAETVAMTLPGTSFYLGAEFAPVRKMIDLYEIPVAMASDFNPGSCPSLNLQFVINLGYLKYRMTPEEILTAVTLNPAFAIGMADKTGTIQVGKYADFALWNAEDMEMLCYRFGSNLAYKTFKKGNLI